MGRNSCSINFWMLIYNLQLQLLVDLTPVRVLLVVA